MSVLQKYKMVPISVYQDLTNEVQNLAGARAKMYSILDSSLLSSSEKTALFEDMLAKMRKYSSDISPPLVQVKTEPIEPTLVEPLLAGQHAASPKSELGDLFPNLNPKNRERLKNILKALKMDPKKRVMLGEEVLDTRMQDLLEYILKKTDSVPVDYEKIATYYKNARGFRFRKPESLIREPNSSPPKRAREISPVNARSPSKRQVIVPKRYVGSGANTIKVVYWK
jgi:hypothetical protein